MTLIEEAITNWFGERCPDYEYGCPACDAWAEYDELNPTFGERLIEALEEAVLIEKLMRENEELRDALDHECRQSLSYHNAYEGEKIGREREALFLRAEIAEWQQREDSAANAFIQAQADLKSAHDALAEEKALADQADAIILKIINGPQVECIPDNDIQADIAAYRKARGM